MPDQLASLSKLHFHSVARRPPEASMLGVRILGDKTSRQGQRLAHTSQ